MKLVNMKYLITRQWFVVLWFHRTIKIGTCNVKADLYLFLIFVSFKTKYKTNIKETHRWTYFPIINCLRQVKKYSYINSLGIIYFRSIIFQRANKTILYDYYIFYVRITLSLKLQVEVENTNSIKTSIGIDVVFTY